MLEDVNMQEDVNMLEDVADEDIINYISMYYGRGGELGKERMRIQAREDVIAKRLHADIADYILNGYDDGKESMILWIKESGFQEALIWLKKKLAGNFRMIRTGGGSSKRKSSKRKSTKRKSSKRKSTKRKSYKKKKSRKGGKGGRTKNRR
jgi:hypothetical protein